MRTFAVIASLVFVVASVTLVALIAFGPRASDTSQSVQNRVLTDLSRSDLLEADRSMLKLLRVGEGPGVRSMYDQHPTWLEHDTIISHEEHQAQLDRMIARRPGQP